MVDEVLGIEPATCVVQYLVATYMTTNAEQRAEAVRDAIAPIRSDIAEISAHTRHTPPASRLRKFSVAA